MKPVSQALRRRIGRRIRTWRKQRRLSQTTLAFRLNVSPEAISLIERGRRTPGLAMAAGLCRVLKYPLHALFQESSS